MSKSYIFKVNDSKEIDLARISRENPEAEALIVTGFPIHIDGHNAAILLNNRFLSKFNQSLLTQNKLCIIGNVLNSQWGYEYHNNPLVHALPCHRINFIHTDKIPQILHELREAKKSLKITPKKHTIKVTELDIDGKQSKMNWKDCQRILDQIEANHPIEKVATNDLFTPEEYSKRVKIKRDIKAGTLVSLDDVLFIEDEAYQMGGPSIGDDKCEPCPIDPRENDSPLIPHIPNYVDNQVGRCKHCEKPIIYYKNLGFWYHPTQDGIESKLCRDGNNLGEPFI